MQQSQRVIVDGELSESSYNHLHKVCHTQNHHYYHYCATRSQMFDLRASSRLKVPAASIVGFDVINNPDDFYHTIMSTGMLADVSQILGIRMILESRRTSPTTNNRYGLAAEGQALFDHLDILLRRCGVFIVAWGSFDEFCSLHQRGEHEMASTLQLFLSDVHHFLSQQQDIFPRLLNQTFPQCN